MSDVDFEDLDRKLSEGLDLLIDEIKKAYPGALDDDYSACEYLGVRAVNWIA